MKFNKLFILVMVLLTVTFNSCSKSKNSEEEDKGLQQEEKSIKVINIKTLDFELGYEGNGVYELREFEYEGQKYLIIQNGHRLGLCKK